MFKNIYVDKKNNTFTLWKTDGSVETNKFKCRSWVESPGSINSPYKTIYGVPVVPVLKTYNEERFDNQNGNLRNEADIQPEIRILSEYYEKEDNLDFDISQYNVMTLDIEVKNGSGFPEPEHAARQVNVISCYSTFSKKYTIFSINYINKERIHRLIGERNEVLREQFPDIDITNNYEIVECIDNEELLLSTFFQYINNNAPDILSGWNCIDKNSNVWLGDRISKISDIVSGDTTLLDGEVVRHKNTGVKEANLIKTVNGLNVVASNEHLFPIICSKNGRYINTKSKLDMFDAKTSEITKLLDNNRIYMRVDVRDNNNKDYTYRDLINYAIISNVENINILITEDLYSKYRKELGSNDYSYNKAKKSPFRFSIKECRKLINIHNNELLDSISKLSELTVLNRDKSQVTLKLDEVIDNDLFKLLGLIYTDGNYDNKGNTFSIYNKDNEILQWVIDTLNIHGISKTKAIGNGNGCGRVRLHANALITLLSTLIYDNYDKKIDIYNLSKISYSQFCSLFSGMIDGDGWVTVNNSRIGFCNFNNDDIKNIGELLSWNGVLFGYNNDNSIGIYNREVNLKFINNLSCVGAKKDKIKNITIKTDKDSKSKLNNILFYDGYYYVRVDSIVKVDDVEMCDIETTSHYFNTNYGIKTHNCNRFDLPYLINRAKKLLVYEYTLMSPVNKVYLTQKWNDTFKKQELHPVICGVSCIDYLELYKELNKGSQKESYKLDFIANEELNVGKVKLGDSGLSLAEKDWDSFCLYNLVDSVLVALFEPKIKLLESMIATCSEARIPLEYFFISKRVILGFMMTYMHRKGLVIPYTKDTPKEPYDGAYIKMNPYPYRWVASYDAKAMYPSIMVSCNISPETKIISTEHLPHCCKSVIKNVYYDKSVQGIIPEIVSFIVDGRDEFKRLQKIYSNRERPEYDPVKKTMYERKQKAYKIFANSVYGLLGNNFFQFYDVHNAASITGIGNRLIQHVITYACTWIDNKLPTNEEFRREFGSYANVTIKGGLDDSYVKSFDESDRDMLGKYKRLVLAHTDSFFFDFSDLYAPFENIKRSREEYEAVVERYSNKESPYYDKGLESFYKDMAGRLWDTMTFTEFMLRFNNCIFDKIMGQITKKWSNMHNYREDRMWFKLEKCCKNLVAMSKSHYICNLEYDEGDLLMHLPFKNRLKAVGVEMIKSDTPQWSKDKIMDTLELMFNNTSKQDVARFIGMLKKEYSDPNNIPKISRPATINTLKATLANTFPAPRMGSIIWNNIVESDPDFSNYEPISEGTKVKWVAVREPNKFNIKAISYNADHWPVMLNKYFIIDNETQFNKTFRKPLEKIMEVYGWGNIFDGNVDSIRRYFKTKQ